MRVYVLLKEVPPINPTPEELNVISSARILDIYESQEDAYRACNDAVECDRQLCEELDCDPCYFEVQAWNVIPEDTTQYEIPF